MGLPIHSRGSGVRKRSGGLARMPAGMRHPRPLRGRASGPRSAAQAMPALIRRSTPNPLKGAPEATAGVPVKGGPGPWLTRFARCARTTPSAFHLDTVPYGRGGR